MKLKINLAILTALLLIQSAAFAQITTTFPLNKDVRHGVLDNGMTYYILHNEEPKERASFYFVQNVGAILEDDSQDGLAHFLEHMAFNGTKHFQGKGIIDFLEKHGVRFGYDINAYTAQDQTVYNLSNIPVLDGEGLLDSCLLVLHDWSGYLLLQPEEIEAERGVIHEEWRTRRNSQFRLNAQTSKVLYKDSKYAERDVIGKLEIIDNFKYEELKGYYKTWYRPDQQAVVVVGDVDLDEVEQKVKDLFSSIPLREGLPEREYFNIPDNDEILFGKATDVEAQYMAILLFYKSAMPIVQNDATFRISMLEQLYSSMISMRLLELQQDPNSSSLMLQPVFFPLSRLTKAFVLQAVPKPGMGAKSLEEILTEVERVKRYGFTESELERVKAQLVSQYDNFFQNKDKITNDAWATQLGNHFLQGEPVFDAETEYNLSKELLASISLNDVNGFAKELQPNNNQVLLVTGPEKEGTIYPTKEELTGVIESVKYTKIEPYTDETGNEPLVSEELSEAAITKEFTIDGISDAKGYVLANGAKVVLMQTDYSEDEIFMTAFSYGGTSKLDLQDLASADLTTSLAQYSGLGNFDMVGLQKKMSGKIAHTSPYINNYTEGLSGSSNMKDFESMLQLSYLNFVSPRFDKKAFMVLMNQMNTLVDNLKADNRQAMQDTIAVLSSNHNPRTILFSKEMLEQIDYDKAVHVYKDRFKNVGDFTFVIVGNLDEHSLPLVQKYIGSINGHPEEEDYTDHSMYPAKGKSSVHFVRDMEVPKTTIYTKLSGKMDYNQKNGLSVSIIGKLLDKRYMETIREEEGGSYGVSVGGSLSRIPEEKFSLTISFDTDPEKHEKLLGLVWKEINTIKEKGPDTADLDEVKKSLIKLRNEQLDKNRFWMGSIQGTIMTGNEFLSIEKYEKLVNSIDAKMIKKTAKKMFSNPNIVEVIMNPKK
ncbi:MAG: insulinase family protein [Bacteroidales bacterium]|nr:insulinase family protein [Bacteroidales bacterium]